jgi:hypothetical protein
MPNYLRVSRLTVVFALVVATSLFPFVACFIGCNSTGSVAPLKDVKGRDRGEIAPDEFALRIDLGVVQQGESKVHRCWLVNETKSPFIIEKLKSSCVCVSVIADDQIVSPQQRTLLTVRFDGGVEEDFLGSLGVLVKAVNAEGNKIGELIVLVEVVPARPNSK